MLSQQQWNKLESFPDRPALHRTKIHHPRLVPHVPLGQPVDRGEANKAIGVYIKSIRIRAGITQQALAEAVGCGVSTISRLEAGKGGDYATICSVLSVLRHPYMPEKSLTKMDNSAAATLLRDIAEYLEIDI